MPSGGPEEIRIITPSQRAFWQGITVGELETIQVLLEHRDVDINKYDEAGEQRPGCTALHLAILEMPTWKAQEGRNGIQSAEFVKKFFLALLEHGADIQLPCRYDGEWYLQTAAGKTKSFYPKGYDALGLVLQFIEITRGTEVISPNVTKRLELIRDLLLDNIRSESEPAKRVKCPTLAEDMANAFKERAFADVELVSEGEVIAAHRVVLAARSKVFARMFGSGTFRESHAKRVQIEETDPKSLHTFIKFLYEDALDVNALSSDFDLCQSLIMLSDRYDVDALKIKCSDVILQHHLSVEKAALILRLADQNRARTLRERTLYFVSRNVDNVMATDDFKQLDSELVQEVLRTVVGARTTPKRTSVSKSPKAKKRARTTFTSDGDDDAVRAPPNNGDGEEESDDDVDD